MEPNSPLIKIQGRSIGIQAETFIIAELSANHGNKLETAIETIRAAKEAGADAIKLQTYTADTLTLDSDQPWFRITQGTLWDGKTLHQLYGEAYTPWEWQPRLKEVAETLGMICFSSPFDRTAVDFLEKMECPAYKVASFEIFDIPLIEYMASKGKPVIISTGLATDADVFEAVNACRRMGNHQIALLKCTSAYPAPIDEANLLTLTDMQQRFGTVVGLSDHTEGIIAPIVATTLGGRIIEKHFILDRKMGGPDAAFSLEPAEFKAMVQGVRQAEKAMGAVTYEVSPKAAKNRHFARSLFVVEDIDAGGTLTETNVRSIRPGVGMHPKHLPEILGKRARVAIKRGTPLSWEIIE